jgi:hypothetical protein
MKNASVFRKVYLERSSLNIWHKEVSLGVCSIQCKSQNRWDTKCDNVMCARVYVYKPLYDK